MEDGELTRYLDFYEEVESYKAEFKRLEESAKDIFETYLEVGNPCILVAGWLIIYSLVME